VFAIGVDPVDGRPDEGGAAGKGGLDDGDEFAPLGVAEPVAINFDAFDFDHKRLGFAG
jgi:hypothetical protein